jgi:hypothetical protein
MAKKEKKLCKWKKNDIEDRFDELCSIVGGARYVCRKCGRGAQKKKWLCKAGEVSHPS